jgi:hypothetical protein
VASLASCECSPSFIHPIFGIAVVKGHSKSATPQPSNLQPNKTSGCSMAWSLLDRSTIPQPPENTMTPIMLPLASLLRLSLLFGVVFSDHDRCYAPNGELAESFVSCWDPDLGPTGLCCEPGDQCLNNNLCAKKFIASSFLFYRGSCLDSTWSDPACPNFCTDSWQADPKVYVYACTDKDRTLWGCDEHASIKDGPCEFEAESLELPGMRQILPLAVREAADFGSGDTDEYAIAGEKPEPSSSAEETSTKDPGTTSTTSASDDFEPSLGQSTDTATVTDPSQASSETAPVKTVPESTTTQSSPPPLYVSPDPATAPGSEAALPSTLPDGVGSSPPTAAPSSPPPDDGKSSTAVPIGVGVAVGASVLIASSALIFFYQRKRRRNAPARAETPPPFEFDLINSRAPSWLGPSYGTKASEMQGTSKNKNTPELGGSARVELP